MITLETAQDELKKILAAINMRDEKNFSARVDLQNLMDIAYDETTDVLAKNCSKFHELYPKDLFFKFGSRILRLYNEKFRGVHLGLIKKVLAAYFDGSFKDAKNFSSTPIKFLAAELDRLLKAVHADFCGEKISGDKNFLTVKMVGDASSYGRMIDTLNFVLEFDRRGDEWRLHKIKNVEELVPPILDIAEKYWPASWDLGIKL
ncbi:MAG: hypothetical protein IJQ82_06880 [Selenomonadaceae bacterium]|nr:hypothetical protein [Selenomonadaceae bacterium]